MLSKAVGVLLWDALNLKRGNFAEAFFEALRAV